VTKPKSIALLFTASATIFFTRALLWSTWQGRGPEAKLALHLNTAEMGILVMFYPVGALFGLLVANYLTKRFGSPRLTVIGFSIAALSLVGLAFTVPAANVWATGALLFTAGFPMGIIDFVGNFEGTAVDRMSKRSLLSGIHSIFGVGMMIGAFFASLMISGQVSPSNNFLIISVFVAIPSIWAGLNFPKHTPMVDSPAERKAHAKLDMAAWREKRTLLIATYGVAFIFAEMVAGNWMPLALADWGTSTSEAAAALSLFWVVVTGVRAVGGFGIDRFGLPNMALASAVVAASGIIVFSLTPSLHLPYLGLVLWALGMGNGFPLAITALSDNSAMSSARINMLLIVAYLAQFVCAPIIGGIGQVAGLAWAFMFPVVFLALAAAIHRITVKPAQ